LQNVAGVIAAVLPQSIKIGVQETTPPCCRQAVLASVEVGSHRTDIYHVVRAHHALVPLVDPCVYWMKEGDGQAVLLQLFEEVRLRQPASVRRGWGGQLQVVLPAAIFSRLNLLVLRGLIIAAAGGEEAGDGGDGRRIDVAAGAAVTAAAAAAVCSHPAHGTRARIIPRLSGLRFVVLDALPANTARAERAEANGLVLPQLAATARTEPCVRDPAVLVTQNLNLPPSVAEARSTAAAAAKSKRRGWRGTGETREHDWAYFSCACHRQYF